MKSLQDLLRGSEGKSALLDSEFKAAQGGGGGESAVKKKPPQGTGFADCLGFGERLVGC